MVLIVVLATSQGSGCSLPPGGIQTGRVGTGMGDALLEALSPFDRGSLKLCGSGGSMVLGVDAVGGPPDGDFADEGGAQRSARRCPCGLGCVVEGVASDVMGEVGDQLGSLGQVVTPVGVILDRLGIPGSQGSGGLIWVGAGSGRRQSRTAAMSPAVLRSRPSAACWRCTRGCSPVSAARAIRSVRRVGQAGSSVTPGTIWSARRSSASTTAGSDELFGGGVQPVGVALHRLMQPEPQDR